MSFQWDESCAERTMQENPGKAPRDAEGSASLRPAALGVRIRSLEWEEGKFGHTELGHGTGLLAPHQTGLRCIPPERATTVAPEPLPPFSDLVEIECQDCGGRGYDPGGVNPREAEDCSACHGTGKEAILRNYLAEAFRIAANPKANVQLERAHIVALTAYARQTVNALMSVQDVA